MTRIHGTGRSRTHFESEQPKPDQRARDGEGSISGIRRRVLSAAAVAVVAVAALTSTANAASTTSGDFSSLVSNNPSYRSVDDCTVELGPVFESWRSNYVKIGGVRVNCTSVHRVIKRVRRYVGQGAMRLGLEGSVPEPGFAAASE